jgi:glycine/D-amino acid oxidase-like deaminating enzyme
MRVVICGGGVIGACTAYFLARRGIDVLVIERTEVAVAASGWRSTGAPAPRLTAWRGGASSFMLSCPTKSPAIGPTSA